MKMMHRPVLLARQNPTKIGTVLQHVCLKPTVYIAGLTIVFIAVIT